MYTLCWVKHNPNDPYHPIDGWNRCESTEEAAETITRLVEEQDVCEEDILVFTPNADDSIIPAKALLENNEHKKRMKAMTEMLLQTLNDYAKLAKAGNKNVLPAMGRIIQRIESTTGRKVVVSEEATYVLK